MPIPLNIYSTDQSGSCVRVAGIGTVLAVGESAPNGQIGYAPGSVFVATATGATYRNAGTLDASAFQVIGTLANTTEYDAELDIGLVADDFTEATATANTTKLNAALAGMTPNSSVYFTFADGSSGSVLHPIRFSAKEFYFKGTVQTNTRLGGALYGFGSRPYPMGSQEYGASGNYGGASTRFTRIDGENGGAVLRLRGTGFTIRGIDIRGQRWFNGATGLGTKTPAGIEVEGRANPATGEHIIQDCAITFCDNGILCKAGYYDTDGTTLVSDENHADTGIVNNVHFWGCGSCFRSENQQAIPWNFHNVIVSGTPTVVIDAVRGGNYVIDGILLMSRQATLFRVKDYSPNNRRLVCNNLQWDGFSATLDDYLTLFEHTGVEDPLTYPWSVRVTGHLSHETPAYDTSKLIVMPNGGPTLDLMFDIDLLPQDDFELVGSGPWWRPAQE